jgi:plasmid stabilization system protein ParE
VGAKLRFTARARQDLLQIRTYLTDEASESVADRQEQAFQQAFEAIARLLPLGHARYDVSTPTILYQNVGSYVIAFRRIQGVQILRVLHGHRDFTKVFKR